MSERNSQEAPATNNQTTAAECAPDRDAQDTHVPPDMSIPPAWADDDSDRVVD